MPTVEEILGSEAAGLLQHQCKTISKDALHLPGPDFVERIHLSSNRPVPVLGKLQSLFDHGRLGGHGLRVDPARRSGHRAFGGRVVRAEPAVFRSREHRQARGRGRLQRGRLHARRARHVRAQVRAQDSVHPQVQPQRVHLVPEQLRPDPLRERQAGLRHGRGGRRRDDLFRLGRIEAAAAGSDGDVPAGARARDVHRALVLPAATRRSRRRKPTITSPPISPARPITSA